MIDFVITGTGRSSTKYVAEALTAAEMPCAHEHACSSWTDGYGDDQTWRDAPRIGESSWQAAPFVGDMQRAGVVVVHLVRHPVVVASSMVSNRMLEPEPLTGLRLPWHNFIAEHIGDHIWRLHPHDRALRFWVDWNRLIETPDLRWDAPIDWVDVDRLSRLVGREFDRHKIDQVPRTINHWCKVEPLSRRDFVDSIYDEAMDLWRSYGF